MSAAIIKARALLGKLGRLGLEASRPLRRGQSAGEPDSFLAAPDGRAWLVAFWAGTTLQPDLLVPDESAPPLENPVSALLAWRQERLTAENAPAPALLILAPLLPAAELPGGVWRTGEEPVSVVCQEDCRKAAALARAILTKTAAALSPAGLAHWRVAAVPEVKIDSPRRRIVRETPGLAAPLLLDYKQERCARLDLEPAPETTHVAHDLSLRLVTGVAGCGKTLVLVHRAALLATHFPQARVLVLSFNRPLIHDLQRRLRRLGAGRRVECLTFHQWLARNAPSQGDMLKPHEVRQWIEAQRRGGEFPSLTRFDDDWIRDEMAWMCDHEAAGEDYLTMERKGRGTPLTPSQRREMRELLTKFRAHLRSQAREDWNEHPLHVWENRPPAARAVYDHVLVDETQFFAPVWIRLLLRDALKPGGQLFLCADPTQGFLKRRTSWASLGLDVRSRSHRLEVPYRSTRALLEFAREFYLRRLPDDNEPLNLPAPEWLETLEPGTPPVLQPAGAPQDQIARLVRELQALRGAGVPGGDVLILVAGRSLSPEDIVRQLCRQMGPHAAALLKDETPRPDDCAGVAHLMAATGLECPVVFLLGIDDLAADEANPTLTPEEGAERHRDHTRQIYVGLTRAIERLVIYSSHTGLRRTLDGEP